MSRRNGLFALAVWVLLGAVAGLVLAGVPSASAEGTLVGPGADGPNAWKKTAQYGDWQIFCQNDVSARCWMAQSRDVEQGAATNRLLDVRLQPATNGDFVLWLGLPLGVDLQAGAAYQVDKGEQVSIPFRTCLAAGCRAAMLIPARQVDVLAAGNMLRVGFRPLGDERTVVVEVPLTGSSQAIGYLRNAAAKGTR